MASIFRTRRTTDERPGGKIVRGRRITAAKTPYDRPAVAASPTGSHSRSPQNPSWFTGFVLPTSRLIASGATKLLSIFGPDPPSSSDSESSSEDGIVDETENEQIPAVGVGVKESNGSASELLECIRKESKLTVGNSDVKPIIERLLMQETYSREEYERLLQIISSRISDGSTLEDGQDKRKDSTLPRKVCNETPDMCIKAVMEAKQWLEKKKVESILNSDLDHGTCTPNSFMPPQFTKDELGSPVDMAKLYMRARPPWVSPLNHLETRTPSPKGTELSKQETQYSAAQNSFLLSKQKSYSTGSGSWNIEEEIRRVRSKATEDMLKSPTTKIGMSSFAMQPKSIEKSLLTGKIELDQAPVLEVTQDGPCNEDLSSQPFVFSKQNQDLQINQNLEGEEHAASKSHQPIIPELALDYDSRLSGKTSSTAREETELRGQSVGNGFALSGSSSPAAGYVGQSPETSNGRNPSPSSSRQDKSVNSIPIEETCELLTEASVEVPILNETPSTPIEICSHDSCDKPEKITQPNPSRGLAAKTTGVEKQPGRRLSGYNRKRRGKA